MTRLLHSNSLRYALALWLATVFALLIAFVLQLEPAQWAGITVWIIFMQNPRMNYSKVIWWSFGTITGALMAVVLIACFNQAPELFLFFLALWLAVCAAISTFVKSYRAYGWVLAGYTCAIVSMSALETPEMVFRLAVTRVSCIFIGMASAILTIILLLPKHRHWKDTLHHLEAHLKNSLAHAAMALTPGATPSSRFSARHMIERLSTVEHTLDITTAESADSRLRAPQARSLVSTLFSLLAAAQAIEFYFSRPGTPLPPMEVQEFLTRVKAILIGFSEYVAPEPSQYWAVSTCTKIRELQTEAATLRRNVSSQNIETAISNQFILDRLDEILEESANAIQDWSGLFGPWTAQRPIVLAEHRDYRTAFIYGLRMFLAMSTASILCFIMRWPSGSQFILFMGVVCSLLSLVEYAPALGFPLLKSATFCALTSFVYSFWLLQKGEGFIMLALFLGIFLLPAAYAYRHPRLHGGAVISMLIFYGLTMPANQMNYDISAFLNNGMQLLCAVALGFFAFHAVPSLTPQSKRVCLLRATLHDLTRMQQETGSLREQRWTSCMFDRLRLLHRAQGTNKDSADSLAEESKMITSLQIGLRQLRLRPLLETNVMNEDDRAAVTTAVRKFRKVSRRPDAVATSLKSTSRRLQETLSDKTGPARENTLSVLAELREMALLMESPVLTTQTEGVVNV
jgi:uncharacterized membrane protein YccC